MTDTHGNAVAIMGATATGKSDVAIQLAEIFGGEVVSMDSRQVYRGFDIGTAKISASEQRGISHHLIDILDPDEPNSAGKHVERALAACAGIIGRNRVPILAGGTGLYFRALFYGLIDVAVDGEKAANVRKTLSEKTTSALITELKALDPVRANELHESDRLRIHRALEIFHLTGKPYSEHVRSHVNTLPWAGSKIVLTMPREKLRVRIAERTREMFEAGWVNEVQGLLRGGRTKDVAGMLSLGYREIAAALKAGEDPSACIDAIITQTRKYAKRQETFFRSESDAVWIDVTESNFMDRVVASARGGGGL